MIPWLIATALALPDVDQAVKTGARNDKDAALVVGIEDYFMLPDVPHATADAEAFRNFLIYTRGLPESRVRMLGKGASREQMLTAMDELGRSVAAGGTMWVYFAGHGAADPETGERVLLGADTQADVATFQARSVAVTDLRTAATKGGGRAVFVLDTCYSGRARGGADLVEGKRFAVPTYATRPAGQVIEWTAAGPGEWSGPVPDDDHGAFTYAVLGALRGWADGQRDGTRDGKVSAEEAQLYVSETLRALQITDQHPVLEGSGDIILSVGDEAAPTLTADVATTDTGSAPSAPGATVIQGDPSQPGQLMISSMALVFFVLDGQVLTPACEGCMRYEAYRLSPGPHQLEVRGAMGQSILSRQIDIGGGQQLRLNYKKKVLDEIGRGPAVEEPAPVAAPVDAALDFVNGQLGGQAQQAPAANSWFGQLIEGVKSTGFSDRKVAMSLNAISMHGVTMAQLGLLLDEIPYSDDRMGLLMGAAPMVVDPMNVGMLEPHLKFSSERELASQLFGQY